MFVTSGKDGTLRYTEPDRVLNTLARARERNNISKMDTESLQKAALAWYFWLRAQ